jgi:hypothetical protein
MPWKNLTVSNIIYKKKGVVHKYLNAHIDRTYKELDEYKRQEKTRRRLIARTCYGIWRATCRTRKPSDPRSA